MLAGAILGAGCGLIVGIIYVKVAKVSSFEGYSSALIFFLFLPVGLVIGAVTGLVFAVRRRRAGRR